MVTRTIRFKKVALRDERVLDAMKLDNVAPLADDPLKAEVLIEDSVSDDFHHLRATLLKLQYSYDFHQKGGEKVENLRYYSRDGERFFAVDGAPGNDTVSRLEHLPR